MSLPARARSTADGETTNRGGAHLRGEAEGRTGTNSWTAAEVVGIALYPIAIPIDYRLQTKLREDNVFTGVCHSVGGGWVGG